jgi:Protein of unknown function (DUF541)
MSIHPGPSSRMLSHLGPRLLLPALAIVLGACTSAAGASPADRSSATPMAATGTAGPVSGSAGAGSTVISVPEGVPAVGAGSVGGSGSGSTGGAIAYPYPIYGGVPGVAPDHSILVTGSGQATMKADGSDRAAAEKTALNAAVADARDRADEVARATGVTITGVLSVSVSVGQGFMYPLGIESPNAPTLPSTNGSAPVPAPCIAPTTPQIDVTVTIAYSIG